MLSYKILPPDTIQQCKSEPDNIAWLAFACARVIGDEENSRAAPASFTSGRSASFCVLENLLPDKTKKQYSVNLVLHLPRLSSMMVISISDIEKRY